MNLPAASVLTFVGFLFSYLACASNSPDQVVPGSFPAGALDQVVPDSDPSDSGGQVRRGIKRSADEVSDLSTGHRCDTPIPGDRVLRRRVAGAGRAQLFSPPLRVPSLRRSANRMGRADKARHRKANFQYFPEEKRGLLEVKNGMGMLLDSYLISGKPLGRGTIGMVFYSPGETPDSLEVAIKCASPHHAKFLKAEAELMQMVGGQRHVLACLKHFPGNSEKVSPYFLVMPFAGLSLRDAYYREEMKFSTKDVCEIGRQAADALDYLHEEHGIMHADLKTENLLVQKNGDGMVTVRLADLSHAGALAKCGERRTIASQYYRPPEILLGWLRVWSVDVLPKKVDVYGLGVVLVEVAAGETLFIGKNEEHQLQEIFAVTGAPKQSFRDAHGAARVTVREYRDNPDVEELRTFTLQLDDLPEPETADSIALRLQVFVQSKIGREKLTQSFVELMAIAAKMILPEAADRSSAGEVRDALAKVAQG